MSNVVKANFSNNKISSSEATYKYTEKPVKVELSNTDATYDVPDYSYTEDIKDANITPGTTSKYSYEGVSTSAISNGDEVTETATASTKGVSIFDADDISDVSISETAKDVKKRFTDRVHDIAEDREQKRNEAYKKKIEEQKRIAEKMKEYERKTQEENKKIIEGERRKEEYLRKTREARRRKMEEKFNELKDEARKRVERIIETLKTQQEKQFELERKIDEQRKEKLEGVFGLNK